MQHSQLNRTKLELLAPAKDFISARNAILCGADAVFIGGPAFGARADATNKIEDIKKVCTLAHRFGVKVHVTLNTLLYDEELKRAQEIIYELADAGIDVLIVQDLSVFSFDIPKGIELHASTQCCIDTVEKLKFYESLGVTQVVLPREFTYDKIREFHEACPKVRLEAFILGALCVGVSGICHISDYLKGRSANRGSCAQICRLPMQLFHNGKEIAVGHLLSLKDNNLSDHIAELVSAGVTSFKIEGRLKDKNYVGNTTAYVSSKLDSFISDHQDYKRASYGKSSISFKADINKTFNRGFTDGLFTDNKKALPFALTPKFLGPKIGKVISVKRKGKESELVLSLSGKYRLNKGDGLTYIKEQNPSRTNSVNVSERVPTVEGFRINSITEQDNKTAVVNVFGSLMLKSGTIVYKNYDAEFEKSLDAKNSAVRAVSYKLECRVQHKEGSIYTLILNVTDESMNCAVESLDFEFNPELGIISEEKLLSTLSKRLDEYSLLEGVTLEGELDKLSLRLSAVNELRRKVLSKCLEHDRVNSESLFIPFKFEQSSEPLKYPKEKVDSRLVLNSVAKRLYEVCGTKVGLEDNAADNLEKNSVMVCKFCLINEYGTCSKQGGKVSGYTLGVSGKTFKIKVDCKNCFMHIVKE
ncbi:putative protease [Succinivibrio dextrinosolvens]|nr:putative protease [Succinivibrio dextrinosolvens]